MTVKLLLVLADKEAMAGYLANHRAVTYLEPLFLWFTELVAEGICVIGLLMQGSVKIVKYFFG